MPYVTYYEPIIKIKNKDEWFMVNGATNKDKDEAIRLASKHVSIRDGEAEIAQINEYKVYEE